MLPNLKTPLIEALAGQGIKTPTEIQAAAFPHIQSGRDIIAGSPTGTGKTLAYLLPILNNLSESKELAKRVQALVLLPSYELTAQVFAVACELGASATLLVGSASVKRQEAALKEKPQIVIGSPGRVLELIMLKKLQVHFVKTVVLDECDKLTDKNSLEHVKKILKAIPHKGRQTLLFSATANSAAAKENGALAEFLKEPILISAGGEKLLMPENLSHMRIVCERRDKFASFKSFINREKINKALFFVKNAKEAEHWADRLEYHGIKAKALSADMRNNERRNAIESFRNGNITVLAATDAAARGLDIKDLDYVVNAEPPFSAEEYLHRAGRAGRMGRSGVVVTIVSGSEAERLESIFKKLNI